MFRIFCGTLILRGFISGRGRTLKSILPNAKGGEYTRGGEITEMKVRCAGSCSRYRHTKGVEIARVGKGQFFGVDS
jgi:hypothetical protein